MILKFGGFNVLGHGSRNDSFFHFLLLILFILSLSFLLIFTLSCILCFSISQVLKLCCFHQIENPLGKLFNQLLLLVVFFSLLFVLEVIL